MNIKRYISASSLKRSLATAALLTAAVAAGARSVDVALANDTLLMGRVTTLDVAVNDPSERIGYIVAPVDSLDKVEFVDAGHLPSLQRDDKGILRAQYKIQSFDSGSYIIPPMLYVTADGDTLLSNFVTLEVVPVEVDPQADINPENTDTYSLGSKWYDILPDFLVDYWLWMLLGLLIIAGGICGYLIYTKRIDVNLLPKKKPEPPYDMAIRKLNALREEHLWDSGQDKTYYTRLTDILREYLQNRFGINAMEMTSSEIISAVRNHSDIRQFSEMLRGLLTTSDFVKFAKMRPETDVNIHSYDSVVSFVEETKPEETPEDDADNGTDGAADSDSGKKPGKNAADAANDSNAAGAGTPDTKQQSKQTEKS